MSFFCHNQTVAQLCKVAHLSGMGREREFLLGRIRLALAGDDAGDEQLVTSLPNPSALDRLEKAAWIALDLWADDAELRASHCRWEHFERQRLQDLSVSLLTVCAER